MRYISQHSNLVLYKDNGEIAHSWDRSTATGTAIRGTEYKFGTDGVLGLGTLTTNSGYGNYIDAASVSWDTDAKLAYIYDTDLSGATTTKVEMAGQGDLTDPTDGYRGIFFEAPTLQSDTAVSSTSGVYYEVISGSVIYDSTTYNRGDQFVTDGSETAVTGTGTFALAIPPMLAKKCDAFRTEHFKIKSLATGNESTSYWDYSTGSWGGFNPNDSLTSTDSDYFGATD